MNPIDHPHGGGEGKTSILRALLRDGIWLDCKVGTVERVGTVVRGEGDESGFNVYGGPSFGWGGGDQPLSEGDSDSDTSRGGKDNLEEDNEEERAEAEWHRKRAELRRAMSGAQRDAQDATAPDAIELDEASQSILGMLKRTQSLSQFSVGSSSRSGFSSQSDHSRPPTTFRSVSSQSQTQRLRARREGSGSFRVKRHTSRGALGGQLTVHHLEILEQVIEQLLRRLVFSQEALLRLVIADVLDPALADNRAACPRVVEDAHAPARALTEAQGEVSCRDEAHRRPILVAYRW